MGRDGAGREERLCGCRADGWRPSRWQADGKPMASRWHCSWGGRRSWRGVWVPGGGGGGDRRLGRRCLRSAAHAVNSAVGPSDEEITCRVGLCTVSGIEPQVRRGDDDGRRRRRRQRLGGRRGRASCGGGALGACRRVAPHAWARAHAHLCTHRGGAVTTSKTQGAADGQGAGPWAACPLGAPDSPASGHAGTSLAPRAGRATTLGARVAVPRRAGAWASARRAYMYGLVGGPGGRPVAGHGRWSPSYDVGCGYTMHESGTARGGAAGSAGPGTARGAVRRRRATERLARANVGEARLARGRAGEGGRRSRAQRLRRQRRRHVRVCAGHVRAQGK